jgi:hypothetical protein
MTLRARLRQLVDAADPGGSVTVRVAWLAELVGQDDAEPVPTNEPAPSWRTLLWTAPDDTLLGVLEIAEAVGRPASWVYRRTGPKSQERLPVQRLGGEVVIRAEDLRRWVRRHLEPGEPPRRLRAG